MIKKLRSISKIQILGVFLILAGLVFTVRYARGTFYAYRTMEFARAHGFAAGNPDPDLIRPWMNLRYIGVAYTVPIEFLFAELDIPVERGAANASLRELNDRFFDGQFQDDQPIILDELREAILKYREDPVPTGLRKGGVRPWMSIQYIANSTGIPAEHIFEQVSLPMEDHAFIPLQRLVDEVRYEPGLRALVEKIQQVVDAYEETE